MATATPPTSVGDNGKPAPKPAGQVLIRAGGMGEEQDLKAVLKRQVPAWIISGGIHVCMIAVFLLFSAGGTPAPDPTAQVIDTKVDEPEDKKENFENPEIGLDPDLPTEFKVERIEDVPVPGPVQPDQPIGMESAPEQPPMVVPPPPGLMTNTLAGSESLTDAGTTALGQMGGYGGPIAAGFRGRSGATRDKMVTANGGNGLSEAAVARGLSWLSKQQKQDGRWVIDGSHKSDVAGTGIALLPFLAAGETHKSKGKYQKNVAGGVAFLLSKQKPTGDFGTTNMYEHAIATMGLCEAYGMTGDPKLQKPVQAALTFIVNAQHSAGGWRYGPKQPGDTSVTGWQLQALKSGLMCKLSVPKETMKKTGDFLDSVAGNYGATYGYTGKNATPAMSAVGLLCRQYMGWGPKNPNLAQGIDYLKKYPPTEANFNQLGIYHFYYATQVVHFFGGPDWSEFWNPPMRDLLVKKQVSAQNANFGSWNPDQSHTGAAGGRLVCTCLSLLTLEVYYRHLPLYKRDSGGLADLEMGL